MESKLKYAKAVKLATTLKTAAKDVKELTIATKHDTEESKPYTLHKIGQEGRKGDSMFHRCGNPDHLADKCRFKDVTCHQCGKLCRIRSVCKSKKRDPSGRKNSSQPRPVKLVQKNDGSDCDYPLFHFNSTNHAQSIKVLITTDGQSITMEVDTGAALSLISEMIFKEFLFLSTYEYNIHFRKTSDHGNTEALSRCLSLMLQQQSQKSQS